MSDDNPRSADTEQSRSPENGNPTDKTPPLVVTIEPQTKNKNSYEANKEAYCVARWTMIFLMIYTGLTLVVAASSVIATMYAKRSADTAKQSADTATNTFKLTFRPRVEIVSVGPFRESRNGVIDNHTDGGFLRVQVGYLNRGPFTAKNVRIFTYDSIGPTAIRESYKGEPQEFLQIPPTGEQTSNTYLTGKNSYTPVELQGLIKGTLRATFSVLIVYDDDLGKQTHHAEYCDVFTLQPFNDLCPWPVQND